jgi:NitT/TauT family transport system permease protein
MTVQAVERQAGDQSGARSGASSGSVLRRYPHLTISPAILVVLLAAWWLASDVLGAPAFILPAPEQVLQALVRGLARAPWDHGSLWYHSGVTVWEALLGFAIGSAAGAGIRTLSAFNRCPRSRSRRSWWCGSASASKARCSSPR